jgi:preprotein translocase subunit SecD
MLVLDKVARRAEARTAVMRQLAHFLLAILFVAGLAACEASPEPTTPTRAMTVTIPVPVADKAVIDAAEAVFTRRLNALGITNVTVTAGEAMTFTLAVPLSFANKLVDEVLRRPGVFQFVPWPADEQPPNPGDRVPATVQPLVDATELTSAAATTDSMGQPALQIIFGTVGAEAFATYTTDHILGYAPLVLDGIVLVAPSIGSPITGGELLITFPTGEGPALPLAAIVAIIDAGPLPDAWTAQR